MELPVGLYDRLVDELMRQRLGSLESQGLQADIESVDEAELPDRIAEVLGDWARQALAAVPPARRHDAALAISAAVHDVIASRWHKGVGEGRALSAAHRDGATRLDRLAAVEELAPTNQPVRLDRPLTPLRDTVLMTNARGQPSVGKELEAEIHSADAIDAVLAFITWSGIRSLREALRLHVERGRRLRVITTAYTGTTEERALQTLAELGAEVKVSYDTSTTRLHAKAWLFRRNSGFSTVYIGSSNLTHSAQVTGLEWNVRASQRRNPALVSTFERTFETYWEDRHFELFDAGRFAQAVSATASPDSVLSPLGVVPFPFQQEILERLQVERAKGRPHNLVVAATGTGKTVVAALDYRRLRSELARARLLFVAHRREILRQSLLTFRHALRDAAFGEMWGGGSRPQRWQHVFASIQSITVHNARALDPNGFDVLIVDEFHHSAAPSYEALLDHLRPTHLLGLTATPERTDGLDVLRWFGGRISVELRLWNALEQGLLSPFHYFASHDGTDLSGVTWRRGRGYDKDELTNVYTADDLWVSKVIQVVRDKVGDPTKMRALGFCASIGHAEFMADRFRRVGLQARSVTSRTSAEERQRAITELEDGQVQALFTVDLFNEGVDIPTIDVVLMLRPTESGTVFLQQLGRGLRHAPGKALLTVLDFVGNQAKGFRFDRRFRAMFGRTRRELQADIQQGFPYLPAGCHIELDPVASKIILANVREALPTRWPQRIEELRLLGDVGLGEYLYETGLDLDDVYHGHRTWTQLRRAAGIDKSEPARGEGRVGRGIARLLHLDDLDRIDGYRNLLSVSRPPAVSTLDECARRRFQGLLLTVLNPRTGEYRTLEEAASALWRHDGLRREALEMRPLLEDQVVHLHRPLDIMSPVPLQVHASYTQQEILAAYGASTVPRPLRVQAGVYWHEPTSSDLCFITLQKSEKHYSPTTRYNDYAISDRLFHWETQSTVVAGSRRGQSYINHRKQGRNVVLFIREARTDHAGRTSSYLCAGMATYVRHRSERPMQITWRLHHPLPGDVFAAYRAAIA